ncbi:MAG: ATP-grasp domain-containing protein [Anderseniella sp.]|nr:ATP-grasp domain-containing protein [Anderseniella sp.]
MSKTALLTLGRLPKALELARALKGAGCRVVVAEPFGWHVCKPSTAVDRSVQVTAPNTNTQQYLDDLMRVISEERVDIVVPVSEEALHAARLKPFLPAHVSIFSPGQAQLLRFHDKLEFAHIASSYDLDVPETFFAGDPAAVALSQVYDHIIKPVHSCSGIGVEHRIKGTTLNISPAGPDCVVQAFVPGRHVSSFSVAHEGREIVTVLYEGTVFCGTVAVCFTRIDKLKPVNDWITRFIDRSGYSGFISFDFIVSDEGRAWAIECNPRATSGVHFLNNADLARAILQPSIGLPIRFKKTQSFQQSYTTLTEAYRHILRPREFLARMKHLFSARDAVWSTRDPMPFLLMTPMSWNILKPAMFSGISLGEAATRDIAWFGAGSKPRGAETGKVSQHGVSHDK